MLIETGEVVAVEDEAVWVETLQRSTCGTCAAQKGCGHGLLNRMGAGRRHYIRVLGGAVAPSECRVGDTVDIALPESVILQGSVIVYLVPLAGMLGLASLAAFLWPGPELATLAGAAVGFLAGVAVVRWHAARHRGDPGMQPTLAARRASPVAAISLA